MAKYISRIVQKEDQLQVMGVDLLILFLVYPTYYAITNA